MSGKIEGIVEGLLDGGDLEKVLKGAGVTAAGAVRLLEGKEGKRQLEARRILGRMQVEMIAHRWGARAMMRLCGLLEEPKRLDLRMKAAVSVLERIGAESAKRDAKGTEAAEEDVAESEGETELLMAVAEVLAERRRRQLMGAPPRANHEGAKGHEVMRRD